MVLITSLPPGFVATFFSRPPLLRLTKIFWGLSNQPFFVYSSSLCILCNQKKDFLHIGDLDENGVRTGMGHLEVPNGSTFDGSFDKVDFYLFFLKNMLLCKDLNLI